MLAHWAQNKADSFSPDDESSTGELLP